MSILQAIVRLFRERTADISDIIGLSRYHCNPVSGQNLAQLSEFRRFEMLFVLPRVSTSKKIWVDNFLCVSKPVTTPFLKRGKIFTKIVEICLYYWIGVSK